MNHVCNGNRNGGASCYNDDHFEDDEDSKMEGGLLFLCSSLTQNSNEATTSAESCSDSSGGSAGAFEMLSDDDASVGTWTTPNSLLGEKEKEHKPLGITTLPPLPAATAAAAAAATSTNDLMAITEDEDEGYHDESSMQGWSRTVETMEERCKGLGGTKGVVRSTENRSFLALAIKSTLKLMMEVKRAQAMGVAGNGKNRKRKQQQQQQQLLTWKAIDARVAKDFRVSLALVTEIRRGITNENDEGAGLAEVLDKPKGGYSARGAGSQNYRRKRSILSEPMILALGCHCARKNQSGQRPTNRQLRDWLQETFDEKVSRTTMQRYLKRATKMLLEKQQQQQQQQQQRAPRQGAAALAVKKNQESLNQDEENNYPETPPSST